MASKHRLLPPRHTQEQSWGHLKAPSGGEGAGRPLLNLIAPNVLPPNRWFIQRWSKTPNRPLLGGGINMSPQVSRLMHTQQSIVLSAGRKLCCVWARRRAVLLHACLPASTWNGLGNATPLSCVSHHNKIKRDAMWANEEAVLGPQHTHPCWTVEAYP